MPDKHTKPTKEELQKQIDETNKELDKPQTSPSPSEPAPTPSPSEDAPSPSPSSEPVESPSPSPEPKKEDKEDPEYKEKFKNSTREALVQKAGREALTKAIEEAEGLPAPTEDEMRAEYPEWDVMSESEKTSATKTVINDRRFKMISEANKQSKDLDGWLKKVDDYIVDPKVLVEHPELEGKEDSFRTFAITPSRRGIPLEDLVKIFIFDATKTQPPKKKGQMIEKPNGGDGTKGKGNSGKISMADAEKLRMSNYAEYKRIVRAGLVDTSEIS